MKKKIDEIYSTPDTVFRDKSSISFRDKDAMPFFLLPNNKVVLGKPRTKHIDYINAIESPLKRRNFINSVILQGRYWKDSNILSFWKMNSDDSSNVRTVILKLIDHKRDGFIYYKDKIYKIEYDNGRIWLSRQYDDNEYVQQKDVVLDKAKENKIAHFFESDMEFVARTAKISTYVNREIRFRNLNKYELLCATCYQVWADFLKTEVSFTTKEFELFIDLKTRGRHSLYELLDYFHNNMRRKMVMSNFFENKDDIDTTEDEDMNSDDLFLNLLNKLGVDDSEYEITYYENSDLPYSYQIRIVDDQNKFKNIVNAVINDGKYVVDRMNARKIYDDSILMTCRIRLNSQYDKFWN